MAIKVFLVIILLVMVLGFTVSAGLSNVKSHFQNSEKQKRFRLIGLISALFAGISLIAFIFVPFSIHTVDTGEVAVVKHFGEIEGVESPGTYFDFWISKSYDNYDTKTQTIQLSTASYSSDAQTMDVQMNVQYRILSDKAANIAEQYGSLAALQQRIEAVVTEKTKVVLSSKKAMDIIADRSDISPLVEEAVKKSIDEKYHVDLQTVAITNIDFSDAFEQAVEDKMVAEQEQLKANYQNETKIAKATANAEAKKISAQAEKEANELLQKSLTDEILQEMWIDKWDGKLPSTIAGDGDTMIMIPSDKE